MGEPARPPHGLGLVVRRVSVRAAERVWLRSVLEAYEGLAIWWASPGEDRFELLAPEALAGELDAVLGALARERPGAFLTGLDGGP